MARRRNADKEQYWRQVLHDWQHSGLTVRAFCAQHQLREPAFYTWKRNLHQRDHHNATPPIAADLPSATPGPPTFAAVRLVPDPVDAPSTLELALPGGQRVRVPVGFDASTLRQLLAVLEGLPC